MNNTLSLILENAKRQLAAANIVTADLDAEVILAHVLNIERIDLYLQKNRQIQDKERKIYEDFIQRRIKREPVAYIIGHKEFWSLSILVTPSVIVPRPETEIIVEKALEIFKNKKSSKINILDLCTGSGCVVAALALEFPAARILATDISPAAIKIAKNNTSFANRRVRYIVGDLFERVEGGFDLITANPPYISQVDFDELEDDIRNYEPRLALLAGIDGLAISKRIINDAWRYLKPTGSLIMEIGIGQSDKLVKHAEQTGKYESIKVIRDYSGIERILIIKKPPL